MIYALLRSAEELKDDIKRYGIEVDPERGMIMWKTHAIQLQPYTRSAICKREIRRYIKMAKEAEHQKQMEKQGSIFDALGGK